MKDISLKIIPNGNERLVKNSLENYLHNPNEKTLITLLCAALSYELYSNNLNEIEFNIKKINPYASYINNIINLNKKTLKSAKKVKFLPNYIKWIFHEIAHLKVDKNNEVIIRTRNNSYKYIHNIINQDFYDIIFSVTKDMELAAMGSMWYYQKNKGEIFARKFGYKKTVEFFEKFSADLKINLQTPEDEFNQLLKSLYSTFPDLRYYSGLIDKIIVDYQNHCLNLGLNNISEKELYLLNESLKENLTMPVQEKLLTELVNCNNLNIVITILENPLLNLTKEQLNSLCKKYGDDKIEKIVFKENIKENNM